MEVSGQLHATAALLLGKLPLVSFVKKAEWDNTLVDKCINEEISQNSSFLHNWLCHSSKKILMLFINNTVL
jgi:hypothetical protein